MQVSSRIKPRRLRPGATLGIIAPASPGDAQVAAAGLELLRAKGFSLQVGRSCDQKSGFLSGPDRERAADIHAMFADPNINGILCLRGGYGTMRLLDLLDYELIRTHPKVFVGYSDITALHTAIGQRSGLVTFHGPMVASDMGHEMPDYTWNGFSRAVMNDHPLGRLSNPACTAPPSWLAAGKARGILAGGNLSLIVSTLGTPYELDTAGKILCLEEVGEAPYRLDRMLTQLLLAGKLQAAAGIVFDMCAGCDDADDTPGFTTEEVLQERLGQLPVPVLSRFYFGHTSEKSTLPFGISAELDSAENSFTITETATIN